jgi:hypothetical protein
MYHSLSTTYFQTIHSEIHNDLKYTIMRPLDNPLMLFSADGTALASIHLRCRDQKNKGRALFTTRPRRSNVVCDFQGLIDRDDQKFELVISNLTNLGHINFNILKTDEKVNTVNPGGLNEINELRPYESYAVQCDYTQGNTELILSTIKNTDKITGETTKVTVKEAESAPEKPQGTYLSLSVVPEITKKELVDLFKNTTWKCVDMFYIKEKVVKSSYMDYNDEMYSRNSWRLYGGPMPHPAAAGGAPLYPMGSLSRGAGAGASVMASPAAGGMQLQQHSLDNVSDVLRSNIDMAIMRGESMESLEDKSKELSEGSSKFRDKAKKKPGIFTQLVDKLTPKKKESKPVYKEEDLSTLMKNYKDNAAKAKQLQNERMADLAKSAAEDSEGDDADMMSPQNNIVDDSFASTIKSGEQMTVNSMQTGNNYDYDYASSPCMICLSVSDKLQFRDALTDKELQTMATDMMTDIVKNSAKQLLQLLSKRYEEEKSCVFCMDGKEDGQRLDVVFYQCGHQCCHSACVKVYDKNTCPLCRAHITAMINV